MLILTDGRHKQLQDAVNSSQIQVIDLPGKSWVSLLNECYPPIITLQPKYLVLVSGIHDLTCWDRDQSGVVTLRHTNKGQLYHHMLTQLVEADRLAKQRYPFSRVIFGDICGMQLEVFNRRYEHLNYPGPPPDIDYEPLQKSLNEVIDDVNDVILGINQDNGVRTPNVSRRLHQISSRRATRHHYQLLPRGLHPSRFLLAYWARKICKLYKTLAGVEASTRN